VDGEEEGCEANRGMEVVMPETRDYKVSLRYSRGYEFVARFLDNEALPPIVFDEPAPLGEGSGPNAAAVLAAAIGDCLAASFAFCLRKVRLEPVDVNAHVVAHVARNEQGRFRIRDIDVELVPEVLEQDRARLQRCEQLFQDFCIVTESVRRGIPVNVKVIEPSAAATVAAAARPK
jgi:organic hydroperoxide reductase OsmC/OhrA